MSGAEAVKACPSNRIDSKSEEGARRRGRPKGVPDGALRANVVRRAHHLFVSEGYGGTTMDAVAARCRMSKRTLYRLFPGKVELFAAVVDAHRQSMLALPGDYDHLPLVAALEAIFRIDITPDEERDRQALLRLVMIEGAQFPELRDILGRCGGEPSRAALADWLRGRADAGEIICDHARAMAGLLMDMVFGAALPKAHGRLEWAGGAVQREHLRRCISVFLNGVVPRR